MTLVTAEPRTAVDAPAKTVWSDPEIRVIDATLRCIARWGVAKTTLDDVAREAGCSRATVYRLFPGGKEGLLEAVTRLEVERFFAALAGAVSGADTLEDLVVAGVVEAAQRIGGHAALQFLAAYELEALVPFLTFAQKDRVLDRVARWAEPWLSPWLGSEAARAGEWIARVVLSYSACPAEGVDLADPGTARQLVQTFLLPGLQRLATETAQHPSQPEPAIARRAIPRGEQ